ncbi:MAG TPA: STAS domain-containing protein [Acidimicrobiales bacterium]|nr:STAS domain-containing protein [Acidimicrobiales bacterium]
MGLHLGLDVSHGYPTTAVTLRGELDLSTAPDLAKLLDLLLATGVLHVTLDLGDLAFVDSRGLRAIASCRDAFVAAGGDLAVRHPRRLARQLLDVLGLAERVPVLPEAAWA